MLQYRDKHDWISSCCSLSLFFSERHIPVDAKVNSACPMLLPPIFTHILSFCGSRMHLAFTCDSLQMISISRTGEGLVRTSSLWVSRHSKRLLMSCEPSRTLSMVLNSPSQWDRHRCTTTVCHRTSSARIPLRRIWYACSAFSSCQRRPRAL